MRWDAKMRIRVASPESVPIHLKNNSEFLWRSMENYPLIMNIPVTRS